MWSRTKYLSLLEFWSVWHQSILSDWSSTVLGNHISVQQVLLYKVSQNCGVSAFPPHYLSFLTDFTQQKNEHFLVLIKVRYHFAMSVYAHPWMYLISRPDYRISSWKGWHFIHLGQPLGAYCNGKQYFAGLQWLRLPARHRQLCLAGGAACNCVMDQEQVRRNCDAYLEVNMSLVVDQFWGLSISSLSLKFQMEDMADMQFPTDLRFQHHIRYAALAQVFVVFS